jgi:hypothetical protein
MFVETAAVARPIDQTVDAMTIPVTSTFPTAVMMEGAVLRMHRQEAELLLRTGAILNAVQAANRHVIRHAVSREDQCDQLHAWIEVASHLTKCYEVFNRFAGLAWDLVALGAPKSEPFTLDMPVEKLRGHFERHLWFMEACFTLRDKVAFHADAGRLLAWLDRQPQDRPICLFSQSGQYLKDIISDAPLQMLDEEAQRIIDLKPFVETLGHVVAGLPRLLDAMCHGFVAKYGLAVDFSVRAGHHVAYFYQPRRAIGAPE